MKNMKSHLQRKGTAMEMSFDTFEDEKVDHHTPPIVRQPSAGPLNCAGSFKEFQLQRANSLKSRELSSSTLDTPEEVLRPPPFSRQPSTRVPIFCSSSFHREPLVRENSLLDDVRTRLHKLIADQQMEELEERFTNEQKRLERILLHAEIQKAVTKKVKELNTIEEEQSIHSRGTAKSRGARTAGADLQGRSTTTNPNMRRAHTTGSTSHHEHSNHSRNSSKSPPTIRHSSSSPSPGSKHGTVSPPRSRRNSRTPPLAHVTFPSVAIPSLSMEKFNKTHAGDSVYHHSRHHLDHCASDEPDDVKDDVSDLGSQCSMGSLSAGKRHQLIIIRQKDINHAEIQAVINEKLPSPEKWAIEEHYTSPAFPALLRTSPKKETSRYIEPPERTTATSASISFRSVVSAVSNKNNFRRGFDEAEEHSNSSSTKSTSVSEKGDTLGSLNSTKMEKPAESERRLAPAPFMKTKSNSSILLTQVTPAPLTVAETGGVPVLARNASISKINVARGSVPNPLRSSQLFALHGTDLHLGELQSEEILESRYRGWTPQVHSLSSKHPSTTNFY